MYQPCPHYLNTARLRNLKVLIRRPYLKNRKTDGSFAISINCLKTLKEIPLVYLQDVYHLITQICKISPQERTKVSSYAKHLYLEAVKSLSTQISHRSNHDWLPISPRIKPSLKRTKMIETSTKKLWKGQVEIVKTVKSSCSLCFMERNQRNLQVCSNVQNPKQKALCNK